MLLLLLLLLLLALVCPASGHLQLLGIQILQPSTQAQDGVWVVQVQMLQLCAAADFRQLCYHQTLKGCSSVHEAAYRSGFVPSLLHL
jgi:hypothetical protein